MWLSAKIDNWQDAVTEKVTPVHLSQDLESLAVCLDDGRFEVRDAYTDTCLWGTSSHRNVRTSSFSGDLTRRATLTTDGSLQVWGTHGLFNSFDSAAIRDQVEHDRTLDSINLSNTGQLLLIRSFCPGSDEKKLSYYHIFDVASGKIISSHKGHSAGFSTDDRLVGILSSVSLIRFYDTLSNNTTTGFDTYSKHLYVGLNMFSVSADGLYVIWEHGILVLQRSIFDHVCTGPNAATFLRYPSELEPLSSLGGLLGGSILARGKECLELPATANHVQILNNRAAWISDDGQAVVVEFSEDKMRDVGRAKWIARQVANREALIRDQQILIRDWADKENEARRDDGIDESESTDDESARTDDESDSTDDEYDSTDFNHHDPDNSNNNLDDDRPSLHDNHDSATNHDSTTSMRLAPTTKPHDSQDSYSGDEPHN